MMYFWEFFVGSVNIMPVDEDYGSWFCAELFHDVSCAFQVLQK